MTINPEHIRFDDLEINRITYCASQICKYDLHNPAERDEVRGILGEIWARLDMWDSLQNGDYRCHCSEDEKEIILYG